MGTKWSSSYKYIAIWRKKKSDGWVWNGIICWRFPHISVSNTTARKAINQGLNMKPQLVHKWSSWSSINCNRWVNRWETDFFKSLRAPLCFFSSPEPKAQVSYCRPFSSIVRRASSVHFLHFHLLLENAWVDFSQTWQESSLGLGD